MTKDERNMRAGQIQWYCDEFEIVWRECLSSMSDDTLLKIHTAVRAAAEKGLQDIETPLRR